MEKTSYRVWCKFLATVLLLLSSVCEGLLSTPGKVNSTTHYESNLQGPVREDQGQTMKSKVVEDDLDVGIYTTGSSLPDCSHACGPCFPCKRVMVSFKCSIAESCPIVYRCMCRGRYYHVPSN